MTREQKIKTLKLLEEYDSRVKYNKIHSIFPDEGPLAYYNYAKHMKLFAAGKDYNERAFIAGNRCFVAGTEVYMADGTRKHIEQVQVGDRVMVYDVKSDTVISSRVTDLFKGRSNSLITVKQSYNAITCTSDHEFLHKSGRGVVKKRPISDILKTSRRYSIVPFKWKPETKEIKFTTEVARLIGYLLGDGCLVGDCVQFTNTRQLYVDDVINIASNLGLHTRQSGTNYYLTVKNGVKGGNPLINLLRELDLWGTRSGTKFIPPSLLTAPAEYVKELVKGLWATDGCCSSDHISYYTNSVDLAKDIQVLLWRLDIESSIQQRQDDRYVPSYIVTIANTDLSKFPEIQCKPNKMKIRPKRKLDQYRTRLIKQQEVHAQEQDIYCITVDHPDHLFIANGAIVGNSGKSLAAGCELVYHLTGLYPHWWTGKRFNKAISAWAVGKSSHTTRDIIQEILLGNPRDVGTGLLPKSLIHDTTRKAGAGQDYINDIYVKHITGDLSVVTLKAYDQERQAFEGTAKDFIWLDEECPQDIYSECLTRTMTCKGCILLTFTPLQGLTPTVLSFLPGGMFPKTPDMCGPVEATV